VVDPTQQQLIADAGIVRQRFACRGRGPTFQQSFAGRDSGLRQLVGIGGSYSFDFFNGGHRAECLGLPC